MQSYTCSFSLGTLVLSVQAQIVFWLKKMNDTKILKDTMSRISHSFPKRSMRSFRTGVISSFDFFHDRDRAGVIRASLFSSVMSLQMNPVTWVSANHSAALGTIRASHRPIGVPGLTCVDWLFCRWRRSEIMDRSVLKLFFILSVYLYPFGFCVLFWWTG